MLENVEPLFYFQRFFRKSPYAVFICYRCFQSDQVSLISVYFCLLKVVRGMLPKEVVSYCSLLYSGNGWLLAFHDIECINEAYSSAFVSGRVSSIPSDHCNLDWSRISARYGTFFSVDK